MKSLRKSLNGNKDSSSKLQISTPVPIPMISKPPSAILPPQKVIRALFNYRSQAPQELSFSKGDFFYVLRDADDVGTWYEAHNPVTGARGIVPRNMFEEFNKNIAPVRTSQVGPRTALPSSSRPESSTPTTPKTQVFYAIVLHDFVAERADELDAKRGDPITVVAQSNREWFVAKPIGRLGRPGLIPVSFVEIHDPSTGKAIPDVQGLMDRGELPKVEDWKRAMQNYKQNSIALGVIDPPSRGSVQSNSYSPREDPQTPPQPQAASEPARAQSPDVLPEGILLSADVVSFHYEMEEYWFRVDAIFQPYARPDQNVLPPAKQLILFRVYNDFYDFQVSLLDTFPREAGRQPPHPRTLPFMPGPAQDVDDALTSTRRGELDEYIHSLCALGKAGGRNILEHLVVRKFLALKPGDVDNEVEARVHEIDAFFASDSPDDKYVDESHEIDVRDQMSRMRVQDDQRSDGSEYEDEGYAPSLQQKAHDRGRHPYVQGSERSSQDNTFRLQGQNHQRVDSSSSFHKPSSSYSSRSRPNSPHYIERNGSPQPIRNGDYTNGQSRWNEGNYQQNNVSTPSTASFRSSQAMSSRSHSHSHSTATKLNNPPISAANPQTAFVKIKIFDRVADDLIAIRVHPKVTHTELMDKVQARLGGEVGNLRYRDSMTNTFVGLDSDEELRAWMQGTDKHVLYAD